jgi:hypothetical protein
LIAGRRQNRRLALEPATGPLGHINTGPPFCTTDELIPRGNISLGSRLHTMRTREISPPHLPAEAPWSKTQSLEATSVVSSTMAPRASDSFSLRSLQPSQNKCYPIRTVISDVDFPVLASVTSLANMCYLLRYNTTLYLMVKIPCSWTDTSRSTKRTTVDETW